MRVAIDTTPLLTGHSKRGVGYYTKRLVESLEKYDKKNEYITFSNGQKLPDVDLVHYPYFDLFFLNLPLVKKVPTVVTLFDVVPIIFEDNYKSGLRGKLKFRVNKYLLKKNVDRIITISNCSKVDIEKYLKIKNGHVDVTYLAADPVFKKVDDRFQKETIKEKYKLPDNFILYVGDVNYNKNLPMLYRSLGKVSCNLVLVGESALNKNLTEVINLEKLASKLGIENKIIRPGYVSDEELVYFYNLAICYVQPSLYEGFGLPVLEAMACGCPVVSSNTSSLVEIGGAAATYFNPENQDQITGEVNKIINLFKKDQLAYQQLVKNCLIQAEKFSWQKTAQKTIETYDKVAA